MRHAFLWLIRRELNANYTQINIIVILPFIHGDIFNVNDRKLYVNTRK